MDIADILDAIEASGVEQIEAIRKKAQEEADERLNAAGKEAKEIREKVCSEIVRSAERQRRKMLHETNLKCLQIEEQARGKLIDEFLKRTRERLKNSREDERYPDILHRLTDDAVKALADSLNGDESVIIESDPRDEEHIRKILHVLSWDGKSKGEYQCWGGVIASSGDGRVKVINTLETRMERAMPYLRKSFSIRLKEDD